MSPPEGFEGGRFCLTESGKSTAALVQGESSAEPEPRVVLAAGPPETARRRHEFEVGRLARWSGIWGRPR